MSVFLEPCSFRRLCSSSVTSPRSPPSSPRSTAESRSPLPRPSCRRPRASGDADHGWLAGGQGVAARQPGALAHSWVLLDRLAAGRNDEARSADGLRRRRGREGHPQGVAGVERRTWPRRAGHAGSCGGGPFPEHRLRAAVEDADTLSSSFPTAVEDASPLSADYTCTGCRSRRAGTMFGERRPAMSARSRRRSSVTPCSPSSTPPTECLIKCQRGGGVVRPPCARCKVTLPIFVPYQTQIPTQHVSQEKTNQT